jgi:hypothetical protein
MQSLNENEIAVVSGGMTAIDVGAGAGASTAASSVGAAFFGAVAEGAELGAAAGPIGMIGGALVGGAVAAVWYATD